MTETTAATTHHRYQGTLGASTFRSAKAETWLATCALAAITKHENRRTTSLSTFGGEGSDPAVAGEPGEGGSAGYSRTPAIDNRQPTWEAPKAQCGCPLGPWSRRIDRSRTPRSSRRPQLPPREGRQ